MRRVLYLVVIAIALIVLLSILQPLWQHARFIAQLLSAPAPGQVAVPVLSVQPADLRDTWGGARSGGRRHEGIDIFAPRGTPVLSATRGMVLRVGENRLGGKVVWVLGPGGQRHYYAHLDGYADVHAGQRVEIGTVLGYVGTTGNAAGTPPHLHYGIYTMTGAINPYPFLGGGSASPPRKKSIANATIGG